MIITTPSQNRVRTVAVAGEIPAQRTAPPAEAQPVMATSMQPPARVAEAVARPVQGPAVVARPTRVAPARAQPLRRRWPAAVGGLAAGLTMGTVGAVGAVFALSATTVITTTAAVPASAVSAASLSPNVSVPGRVLTTFGDGTWQVGVDIAPGTYMTDGAVDGTTCSHALRTARTGGKLTASSTGPGRATVVLAAVDGWFATSGCATWTRAG
jgi:hypothetical protein